MSADLMTLGVGLLAIAILSAPLWLPGLNERWEGKHFTGFWEDEIQC